MADATIHVVDDDEAIRDSLVWLLEANGLKARAYPSATSFLSDYQGDDSGCLVLDVRMPEMTGTALQDRLIQDGVAIPVVFITGHGDVPMAVEAIRKGAHDFIEKPFRDEQLLDVIRRALAAGADRKQSAARDAVRDERLAALTAREREVLDLVVAGKLNKTIADLLGISAKTVEFHRANIMQKTGARSIAELVRLAMRAER